MNNSDSPAHPTPESGKDEFQEQYYGLSKREYFAGLAFQGIISGVYSSKEAYNSFDLGAEKEGKSVLQQACCSAVKLADGLLLELENEKPQTPTIKRNESHHLHRL